MKIITERKFRFEGKSEWLNYVMGILFSMILVFLFAFGFYQYNSSFLYNDTVQKEIKAVVDTVDFTGNLLIENSEKLVGLKNKGRKPAGELTLDSYKSLPGYQEALCTLISNIQANDKSGTGDISIVSVGATETEIICKTGKGDLSEQNYSPNLYNDARRTFQTRGERTKIQGPDAVDVKVTPRVTDFGKRFYALRGFANYQGGLLYDAVLIEKKPVWNFPFLPQLVLSLSIVGIALVLGFIFALVFKGLPRMILQGLVFASGAIAMLFLIVSLTSADYQKNSARLSGIYSDNIKIARGVIENALPGVVSADRYQELLQAYSKDSRGETVDEFTLNPEDNTLTESESKRKEVVTKNIIVAMVGWVIGIILGALSLVGLTRKRGFEKLMNDMYNFYTAYLFILPSILGMLILVFVPIMFTIVLSFTALPGTFKELNIGRYLVGLQNFLQILGNFDIMNTSNFYNTLIVTILYTAVAVIIQAVLGVVIAVILNEKGVQLKGFYQIIFMLPWIIPTYISGLLWNYFFNQNGVMNQLIQVFGGQTFDWLGDPIWSFFIISFVSAWYAFPFIMLVTLSALQTISSSIFEAAAIDGANWFQTLFGIVLPMIRPTVLPSLLLSSIWTFNNFNLVYLVVGGYGKPDILVTQIYDYARPMDLGSSLTYGYAAAYSAIVFAILLFYIYIFAKSTKLTEKSY